MSPVVVADAGPLIALGCLNQIPLLRKLYVRALVPQAVVTECLLDIRLPGAVAVQRAVAGGDLELADDPVDLDPSALRLDRGESAAILTAQQLTAHVLVDEARGRAVARNLGIKVVGTLGVLIAAKQRSFIPELAPLLAQMKQNGYYLAATLVEDALRRVGEAR